MFKTPLKHIFQPNQTSQLSQLFLLGISGMAIALLTSHISISAKEVNPTTDRGIIVANNFQSLQENISQTRKQTEFIDDDTEKIIARNKKWFLLGFIVFLWMAYQSLTMKPK